MAALRTMKTCFTLSSRINKLPVVQHFSQSILCRPLFAQKGYSSFEDPSAKGNVTVTKFDDLYSDFDEAPIANPHPALSITVISGFLGSGKTTLLKHILENSGDMRVGVLVNDMSTVNVDGKLIKGYLKDPEEDILTMSDGCICCTLGGDLEDKVDELAENRNLDYLIVEGSGVALPMHVAANLFDSAPEDGGLVRLDTMVTVVDTHRFLNDVMSAESLSDKGMGEGQHDDRTVADILVEQVEFANILIMNKTDLVTENEKERVKAVIMEMNPSAKVFEATNCTIPVEAVLNTELFDPVAAMESPGWIQKIQESQKEAGSNGYNRELDAKHTGITSFVYRARRPFHPDRLMNDALSETWKGVLRSKGFFWLATRNDQMGVWQSAGSSWGCDPGSPWLASLSQKELPEGIDKSGWHKKWGDRCTELVWIGDGMDLDEIKAMLDSCLLTKEEMEEGPGQWSLLPDNLPPWPTDEWMMGLD